MVTTVTANIEERIDAWPAQLRAAQAARARIRAEIAELDAQLERARLAARVPDDSGLMTSQEALALLDLDYAVREAKQELERAKAEADVEARSGPVKLTDTAVAAQVRSAPEVVERHRALLGAERAFERARVMQDQTARLERRRLGRVERDGEVESDEVRALSERRWAAEARLEDAEVEVKYQWAVGRSLRMRVALYRTAAEPLP
jgi:hypothetical protein